MRIRGLIGSRFAALGERDFRLLLGGRLVSMLGSAIAPVALSFAVLDLTGRASDLGIVLACREVTQVLFLLVGGVIADRLRRNHVMVVTSLVSAISQGTLAALLLTGSARLWELAVLAAVNGMGGAFFFPAANGIVPQLVRRDRLQGANVLLRASRNATVIGGAAFGGVLVAATSPGWGIAADAASYLLGAVLLAGLRLPETARIAGTRFVVELRDGWSAFRSRTWLWVIVVQFSAVNMAYTAGVLLLGPVVADRRLGGAAAWGYISAGMGAGLLAGSLIAAWWRPRRPLFAGTVAVFPMVLPMVALAAGWPTGVVVAAAVLAGLGLEQFGILWATTLQEHIPNEQLSRVSPYDALGSFVFMPVGYAVGGAVAGLVGIDTTIAGSAAIVAVATGLALLSRSVRELPRGETPAVAGAASGSAASVPEPRA